MWEFRYKNDYLNCVYDLMADAAVQSMRLLPQHRAGVSCYHHCVLVSYSSWRLCRALGLDGRAAARAACCMTSIFITGGTRPAIPASATLSSIRRWR